jgi:hypothetical protein
MPSPVDLLSGEMKSPSDCLAPMVTMRTAAAASVITHPFRWLFDGMAYKRGRSGVPCWVGIQCSRPEATSAEPERAEL